MMRFNHKVAYVVNRAEFFLSHRLPVAEAVKSTGSEIHVVTPFGSGVPRIKALGYSWHELNLDGRRLNPIRELATLLQLYGIYRRIQPDLVHHVALKAILYGGIAARAARIPSVVNAFTGLGYLFTTEAPKFRLLRFGVFQMYRMALGHPRSRTIFQNPDDLAMFVRRNIVPGENTVLIKGSGVDIDTFAPSPEPSGTPVALLAGRLLWDKGVAEFVEAARQLKEEGLEARFVLAGKSDPLNPRAIPPEQLEDWEAMGVVEWWGFCDNMPDVFSQVHIVCLPSYREGIPKVLIEAASSARPIVTTDAPGCREIVRDQVNGILVPPRDSRAVAAALRDLLRDPQRRRRMGANGRQIVEEEFSLDQVVRETMAVYERLLGLAGRTEESSRG